MKIFCEDKYHHNSSCNIFDKWWVKDAHGREACIPVNSNQGPIYGVGNGLLAKREWCISSRILMDHFKNNKIAVRLERYCQYDVLMKMCDEYALTWHFGTKCTAEWKPDSYPCVGECIHMSQFFENCIARDNANYCTENGFNVIGYSDFISLGYELEKKVRNDIYGFDENQMQGDGAKEANAVKMSDMEKEYVKSDLTMLEECIESARRNVHQRLVDGVMTDPYDIHISSDGKTTTAKFYVNGKVVREAEAKCHPDDRFNFHTGAEVAFGRLWEKKAKEKTDEEFKCKFDLTGPGLTFKCVSIDEAPKLDLKNLKPGDKVRVRKDLISMVRYGDEYAVGDMVKLAGKIVTISTNKRFNGVDYYMIEEGEEGIYGKYLWTPEMLELI